MLPLLRCPSRSHAVDPTHDGCREQPEWTLNLLAEEGSTPGKGARMRTWGPRRGFTLTGLDLALPAVMTESVDLRRGSLDHATRIPTSQTRAGGRSSEHARACRHTQGRGRSSNPVWRAAGGRVHASGDSCPGPGRRHPSNGGGRRAGSVRRLRCLPLTRLAPDLRPARVHPEEDSATRDCCTRWVIGDVRRRWQPSATSLRRRREERLRARLMGFPGRRRSERSPPGDASGAAYPTAVPLGVARFVRARGRCC